MKLKILSLAASIGILIVLLFYSNIGQVWAVLSKSNPLLIVAALLIATFNMFFRAMRWKFLLKEIGINLPLKRGFPVFMASMFISNVTPGKTGDPFRSYLLKKREGAHFSRSISSVIVERIADILILIAMSAVGIFFIQNFRFAGILNIVIAAYIILIVFVIAVGTNSGRVEYFFGLLMKMFAWLPSVKRFQASFKDKAIIFSESFLMYRRATTIAWLPLATAGIWLLDGTVGYLAFQAIGIGVNFWMLAFIMAVSVLIGVATSLPGGIGSADAVMAILTSSLFYAQLPIATAGVLLFRLLTIWYSIMVGAYFLLRGK